MRRSSDLLQVAREQERTGCIDLALASYETVINQAERRGDLHVLAEALRRLGILQQQRDEPNTARALCVRSYNVARACANDTLAAEALNSLGGIDLTAGALKDAREAFIGALWIGGASPELRARVEQNLGILANIQGDLEEAVKRYELALDVYRGLNDQHGCAIVYHNLGMVNADRERYDDAERYFRDSRAIARADGDVCLEALCLVNHAEVDVARQRYEAARENAEAALALFDQLSARGLKADAYRVLGMMYRETGRPALAESRLQHAIELASETGSVLGEAEASRELALHYQSTGRNVEALRLLNSAYRLFRRLEARVDLIHVGGKVAELEGTYLAVVREWGQSLESSDRYTFGHCERVARNAVAVARALGLNAEEERTVLLGAYLHDVGKVRVPHEILSKPGPLTPEERRIAQMHPTWGVELLDNVEFPWDLKPIIRSHHEHVDGTGYPDGLKGEDIPLAAQIVGLLDVFDALTTQRPYQLPLAFEEAVRWITTYREWWSPAVFQAFQTAIAQGGSGLPAGSSGSLQT
jgi:putative nucleotidyltransferase with HDIG domain